MLESDYFLLVVEPEKNLRQIMTYSLESAYNLRVLPSSSLQDGIHLWQTHQSSIIAIITDHRLDTLNSQTLVAEVKKSKKKVPFIVTSAERPEKFNDLKKYSLLGVEKENIILNLMDKLDIFLEIHKNHQSEYSKISLDSIKNFVEMGEDIFYKLNEQRFIKMFHYYSQPSNEDLERYREKGLDFFYILKNRNQAILHVLDEEMPVIVKEKIEMGALKIGEKTVTKVQIILEEPLEMERDQIEEVQAVMEKVSIQLKNSLQLSQMYERLKGKSLENQLANQHLGYMINVASSIAYNLEWESDDVLSNLVYSLFCFEMTFVKTLSGTERIRNIYDIINLREREQLRMSSKFSKELQSTVKLLQEEVDRPMESERILAQIVELLTGEYKRYPDYSPTPLSLIALIAIDFVDTVFQKKHLAVQFEMEEFMTELKERFQVKGMEQIANSFLVYCDKA